MAADNAAYGSIPLTLGVAGHRHLPEDLAPLRRAVGGVLDGYRRTYPSTPIVVLSALAEGADRLVAFEALQRGFSLVVPMPMAREEYEKDFVTPESRAEFASLLARAASSFVVPVPADATGEDAASRPFLYANCGAYVVSNCVELLALWDGKDSALGGTANVVAFQLDGIPAPFLSEETAFDRALTGPVIHVLTPHGHAYADASQPLPVAILYPEAAVVDPPKAFERAKFDIERFNHEVVRGAFSARVRGLPIREQAETLASIFQRRTGAALTSIFTLVFLAAVGFNVYTTLPSHPLLLLIGYLLCIGLAFVPFLLSKRGEWQVRYQDYRALAEALRTAHFWHVAGIDRSAASRLAQTGGSKFDWIAIGLRALTESAPQSPQEAVPLDPARLRELYDGWIVDQRNYFVHFAGKRDRVRQTISSRIVTAWVVFSVALAFSTHVASSFGLLKDTNTGISADSFLLFVSSMFAIAAALIHDFSEKRGWAEHCRHYEMMAALFGYAGERIAPLLDRTQLDAAHLRQVRAILTTLGDEAIAENAAWLNLHRSRPLNVPRV